MFHLWTSKPTKLKTAAADSSASPETEVRMDRWKLQRRVQGVLGVHVDDLIGGGNITLQKAVQWLWTELEFDPWEQSRLRFRGREPSQEYSRKSIIISMTDFVTASMLHWTQVCNRNFEEVLVIISSGCNRRGTLCCHLLLESYNSNQLPSPHVDVRSEVDARSLFVDCQPRTPPGQTALRVGLCGCAS